jgi:hypothetical protein
MNTAFPKESNAIRHFPCETHFVCDDDHCHAFFRQHAHRVEHFTDELRIGRHR